MTGTKQSTTSNPQPKTSHPAAKLRILVTAFLAFGIAVPFASADCLGKGLLRPQLSPLSELAPPSPLSPATQIGPLKQALPETTEPAEPMTTASATPVSIVGLWNLTFFYQSQIVDVAFDAWHSDGTEILNDYTDPVEGNVCLGVWAQTGASTYTLKHPSWYFDTNGNLLGTVVIHETVTLSADGNSFSGFYTDDVYDNAGNLLEAYSGRIKATRIKPV